MKNIITHFKYLSFPIIILSAFAAFAFFSDSVLSQTSSDAIAIRVIPNPDHYSALRWYTEKKFSGSPQSLLVDGYEAVRDGRTVYVNAANIPVNDATGLLYTNIYVISYNQEAESNTVDIFGQILSHWRFNSNLTVDTADIGQCNKTTDRSCWEDSECPLGEFCSSLKARVVRDTRRLADLADIKIAADKYKTINSKYPTLAAGTYLPARSLSVWPSWQKILGPDLGLTAIPTDPINSFLPNACPGYNEISCWDEASKRFADPVPDNNILDLPPGSHIYVYTGSSNGLSYSVCAVMESGLVEGAGSGSCASESSISVGKINSNHPPMFINSSLEGFTGQLYNGFISAQDPDGDTLTWTIDTTGSTWTNWVNPPTNAPTLENITSNQKTIKAERAGDVGKYNFQVTLSDGHDTTSAQFTVNITPDIVGNLGLANIIYIASTTNPINYQANIIDTVVNYNLIGDRIAGLTYNLNQTLTPPILTINGRIDTARVILTPFTIRYNLEIGNNNGQQRDGSFTLTVINNAPTVTAKNIKVVVGTAIADMDIAASDPDNNNFTYALNGELPQGLSAQLVGKIYRLSGTPNGSIPITKNYNLTIKATDDYHAVGSTDFTITVSNRKPVMTPISCDNIVRANSAMPACNISASDPDGHTISSYQLVSGTYPSGLIITTDPTTHDGVISGSPIVTGTYHVNVTAIDQYGAVSSPVSFTLTVNNYCGDSKRQNNTESRGGPSGNGQEECDGTDGLATGIIGSSATRQYRCSADVCQAAPGSCPNTTCSFAGGWCGDGAVQTNPYIEACDFGANNSCCNNCAWTCPPYEKTNASFGSDSSDNAILSSGESAQLNFPTCRLYDPVSALVDAELQIKSQTIAIVFLTDISNSVADQLKNIKSDLKNAISTLASSTRSQDAFSPEINIYVGLVAFHGKIFSTQMLNVNDFANEANLIEVVKSYKIGSGTRILDAATTSLKILDDLFATVPSNIPKYLIMLSDGGYYPAGTMVLDDISSPYTPCAPKLSKTAPNRQNPTACFDYINSGRNGSDDPLIKVYTVYFNVSGAYPGRMCSWSSEDDPTTYINTKVDGVAATIHDYCVAYGGADNCVTAHKSYAPYYSAPAYTDPRCQYSFGYKNNSTYQSIINKIFKIPPTFNVSLNIGGTVTVFDSSSDSGSYNLHVNLPSGLTCTDHSQAIDFIPTINFNTDPPPTLPVKFSNFRLNYCPLCAAN